MSLAAFIAAQRARYGVPHAVACRALGVCQAWLYKWLHADVSLRRKRRAAVDAAVAYEFARRQGRDGSPPITTRLRDAGWRISKNTVADSMRRQGLVARPRKRRRGLTKAERRAHKPADLLGRDFCPPGRINQRWVSDLTQIDTDEGALYLASILDLRSRRAVGYAMGAHHDADLAAAAVQVAIATRGGNVAGVVLAHRPGRRVLRREPDSGLRRRRHPAVHGPHRVGPGQCGGGVVPLHSGVRAAGLAAVFQPGAGPPGRGRLVGRVQHRPAPLHQRDDLSGRLRERPAPCGRQDLRPAPSPPPTHRPEQHSQQPIGGGFAATVFACSQPPSWWGTRRASVRARPSSLKGR